MGGFGRWKRRGPEDRQKVERMRQEVERVRQEVERVEWEGVSRRAVGHGRDLYARRSRRDLERSEKR